MNRIPGQITSVQSDGTISLVELAVGSLAWVAVVIDTPETSALLSTDNKVNLLVKETEVVVCTGETGRISMQNRISGTVERIKKAPILSRLEVATDVGTIVSIITSRAVDQLEIKEGNTVTLLVKTNEIMLEEC